MKTLYLECNMGAAGDMLMASLYEICDKKDLFLEMMNQAFSKYNMTLTPETSVKCGISGTSMQVLIKQTNHTTYTEILNQIQDLSLPKPVKEHASAIYKLIGDAEAKVHGTDLEHIHFHEVGSLDALADVCSCALLFHLIAPDKILTSPVHVGSGFVKCSHGVLPVPAPATAELLKGIPYYGGTIAGELLTPTGAAILSHYTEQFTTMPVMTVEQIGYGMGKKDFQIANCVRAFLGESDCEQNHNDGGKAPYCDDHILGISCNLDDMTGEAIGFASEVLLNAGALDVYTTPIQMKKGRPGIILTCLCSLKDKEFFTGLIFRHTTTRGVRYEVFERAKLTSTFETISTEEGDIRIKVSEGYDTLHKKPEFEDLRKIALEKGWALEDVLNLLNRH